MTYKVETTIHLEIDNKEIPVYIIGNVEQGQDAARGAYGLPTECATADEVYPTLVVVGGVAVVSDEDEARVAEMFGYTVPEFNEMLQEELLEAFDNEEPFDHSDDMIF